MPANLIAHLNSLIAQRELPSAYQFCQANPGPLTRALSSALTKANYERDMYNKSAMENAVADDCFREETKMIINFCLYTAPQTGRHLRKSGDS